MTLQAPPNVGPVLADDLQKAGIEKLEAVRQAGECEVLLHIRARADGAACPHRFEALAGAAAGVKKSALPPEKKAELKLWFSTLKSKN